jgi:thioredoxin reductase (NADPH)
MSKPVIFSVDDDPAVLGAIERDLRAHYKGEYRIIKASSPHEAIEAAQQLKKRGTPVALFLVDQRMPLMSGTELLMEMKKIYPDARKVLLTAYSDTEAAIVSINEIGLDHYLLKPWHPPEDRLYPVLDDLLAEWTANVRLPYDGIRVAGTQYSPESYNIKEFLSLNHVPYQWVDLDEDHATREVVAPLTEQCRKLPVILFPDGSHLVAPNTLELAAKIGIQTKAKLPFYDLVVVGSGPAGLASAVYGASEGLKTLIIERSAPGGQAGTSSRIENYLGFPSGVTGADLAQRATAQARRFGAEILTAQEAVSFRREDPFRIVVLSDGSEISCKALVLAAGMSVRKLDVPGIDALTGIGVYYGAALSEAATYRDRDVCIIGGANSAGQAALFISRYAKTVTIYIRAASLAASMSQYLIDRIEATENIKVVPHVEITNVSGTNKLEKIQIKSAETGELCNMDMAAMFIFIGAAPHSTMANGFVELDDKGFILTGPDLPKHSGMKPKNWQLERDPFLFETSVPGVFAVGDVRAGANRRVAAAVGEGSAGIYMVHRYLQTV